MVRTTLLVSRATHGTCVKAMKKIRAILCKDNHTVILWDWELKGLYFVYQNAQILGLDFENFGEYHPDLNTRRVYSTLLNPSNYPL